MGRRETEDDRRNRRDENIERTRQSENRRTSGTYTHVVLGFNNW